jgi:hypothetical protein
MLQARLTLFVDNGFMQGNSHALPFIKPLLAKPATDETATPALVSAPTLPLLKKTRR